MLNVALEQGQILTEERAKYPARAKKGEYGWTDFLIDAEIAPRTATQRIQLWEGRNLLPAHCADKPTLTLSDAERIIGARKPKTEAPTKPEPRVREVEATVTPEAPASFVGKPDLTFSGVQPVGSQEWTMQAIELVNFIDGIPANAEGASNVINLVLKAVGRYQDRSAGSLIEKMAMDAGLRHRCPATTTESCV